MTRMNDLAQRLEKLQIAGRFEPVPLAADQTAKLKEVGMEGAGFFAYDGKHAINALVGITDASCIAHVRVPLTAAAHAETEEDASKYLAATQLTSFLPGATIVVDPQGRVNVAFTGAFEKPDPQRIAAFVEQSAETAKQMQTYVTNELGALGFETDLSKDKLLANAAGLPVKLNPNEMQALVGGGTGLGITTAIASAATTTLLAAGTCGLGLALAIGGEALATGGAFAF